MSKEEIIDKPEVSFFSEPGVDAQTDTEQQEADTETADDTQEQPTDSHDEGETEASESVQSELGESEQEDSQKAEIPDKEDPESFKYWQSQAQKYESKLGIKPDEISDVDAQLLQTFRKAPETLNEVVEYLKRDKSKQEQRKGDSKAESQELQEPVEPEKPTDYNPYDVSDPESSTFKYEQEYKQYLRDMIAYERAQRKQFQQSISQKEKQRELTQKQKQFRQTLKQEAMKARGYNEEQAEKFTEFVDRAQNGKFEPGEVFALFEGFSGINADKQRNEVSERQKELERQKKLKEKHGAMSPAATGGAGNPSGKGKNPEDSFFQEA